MWRSLPLHGSPVPRSLTRHRTCSPLGACPCRPHPNHLAQAPIWRHRCRARRGAERRVPRCRHLCRLGTARGLRLHRLLPLLDGSALQANPTWITGFSDLTALHGWASGLGVASLHAPVASTIHDRNGRRRGLPTGLAHRSNLPRTKVRVAWWVATCPFCLPCWARPSMPLP